jgi:DNA modification methylase
MYKSVWDFGREAEAKYGAHAIGEYPTKIMPQVASALVERFSQEGDTILDPFCGGGTFAIEAKMHGRNSINYDINPAAIELADFRVNKWLTKERMLLVVDELLSKLHKKYEKCKRKFEKVRIQKEIEKLKEQRKKINNPGYCNTTHIFEVKDVRKMNLPINSVDAIITDIPYASMIKYTNLPDDLSTIEDYPTFLEELSIGFKKMWDTLKEGKYCVIFCADYRVGAARCIFPVHSDIIQIMRELGAILFDEYIWRYYRSGSFRPFHKPPYQAMNVHTYILVFYKPRGDEGFLRKMNRPVRYRKRLIEKLVNQKLKLSVIQNTTST